MGYTQEIQGSLGGAGTAAARQTEMYGPEASFAKSLLQTQPGQLSQYAKAQYGSDIRSQADARNRALQGGLKSIGYGGRGAPGGAVSSARNATLQQQQAGDTGAYNRAQQQTYQGGLAGAGIASGLQQIYNPVPYLNAATEAQRAQDAQRQAMIGDIVGGVGAAGGFMSGLGSIRGGGGR